MAGGEEPGLGAAAVAVRSSTWCRFTSGPGPRSSLAAAGAGVVVCCGVVSVNGRWLQPRGSAGRVRSCSSRLKTSRYGTDGLLLQNRFSSTRKDGFCCHIFVLQACMFLFLINFFLFPAELQIMKSIAFVCTKKRLDCNVSET